MASVILVLHICTGLLALMAGFSVLILAKGSARHRRIGSVFVLGMLGMGATAFLLGILHASPSDMAGGLLVCYLVATAWAAAPGKPGGITNVERLALLFSAGLTLYSLYAALQAALAESGVYQGAATLRHLGAAAILGLFMLGDLAYVLTRGGVRKLRLFRHVWRMCLSLAGASGAFFLGQMRVFPAYVRETQLSVLLYAVPVFALCMLLYFSGRVLLKGNTLKFYRLLPAGATSLVLLCASLLALSPSRSHAHHSNAGYDRATQIDVSGTITRYDWANPHVYLYVEEVTASGAKVEWEVEGPPPALLRRQGWSRDLVQVGDRVVVSGNPGRQAGSSTLLLSAMARADEQLFDPARMAMLQQVAPSEMRAASLTGTWSTLLSPQVMAYFSNANLAFTSEGTAANAGFDAATMLPGAQCIAHPAPLMMVIPDIKHIVEQDNAIIIAGEFDNAERIIHLNTVHPDTIQASVQGYSTGVWEGDTLVVTTTGFSEHALGTFFAASSLQKRLVERLRLQEDGKGLHYSFALEDPLYLAAPLNGELEWAYSPDREFQPEPCDPDVARRFMHNNN